MIARIIKHLLAKGEKFTTFIYINSRKGRVEFESFKQNSKYYVSFKIYNQNSNFKTLYRRYVKLKYKFGASIEDWYLYGFYDKSDIEIDTYITERRRSELYRIMDEKDFLHIFSNKKDFFERYNQYMQKECVFISDTNDKNSFLDFCAVNNEIVIKPVYGQRGQGVKKYSISNSNDIEYIWNEMIKDNNIYEVDKTMYNCPEIEIFHPQSLNTIRLSVILDKDRKPHVMAATFRTGSGNNCVDNGHHDGIYAAIDIKTGIIISDGFINKGEKFNKHPNSEIQFFGTQIPMWSELISLALKIATEEPHMRYIGWDFVLNDLYKWILLEGNEPGGIDIHQQPLNKGLYYDYFMHV